MRNFGLDVVVIIVALSVMPLVSAGADSTLYENGPFGPDADAWLVSNGNVVADTFTLSGNATVTGFQFWAWLVPGDFISTAEVSITSEAFGGTTYFDQVANFAISDCHVNAYGYDVCDESSTFSGPHLNAGTYWLNLQNAMTPSGDPVFWDENSGAGCHSPGCPSLATESVYGTIPSESFTIMGNGTGSTPEPGTILLLGTALIAVTGFRRKLW